MMPGTPFTTVTRHEGDTAVIELHGDVNRAAQSELERAYEEVSAAHVALNFAGVDYINSTGIAVIVAILARARAERRTLAAYGLTNHYREIFEITRLSDFMTIYDTEEAATAAH